MPSRGRKGTAFRTAGKLADHITGIINGRNPTIYSWEWKVAIYPMPAWVGAVICGTGTSCPTATVSNPAIATASRPRTIFPQTGNGEILISSGAAHYNIRFQTLSHQHP